MTTLQEIENLIEKVLPDLIGALGAADGPQAWLAEDLADELENLRGGLEVAYSDYEDGVAADKKVEADVREMLASPDRLHLYAEAEEILAPRPDYTPPPVGLAVVLLATGWALCTALMLI